MLGLLLCCGSAGALEEQGQQTAATVEKLYQEGVAAQRKGTTTDLRKSIEYFEQAIQRDPKFAPAYLGLANSYAGLAGYAAVRPTEGYPRAKEALAKALELDDTLADAHRALGWAKFMFDWDLAGAEKEFQRALQLNARMTNAHSQYGMLLASMGRFDEALAEANRAVESNLTSASARVWKGWVLYYARRYDEAIPEYRQALELAPDLGIARFYLGFAYVAKSRFEEAIEEYQKSAVQSKGRNPAGDPKLPNFGAYAALGYGYAAAGKQEQARRVLGELLNRVQSGEHFPAYRVAAIYVALGDKQKAFEWLEKEYENRGGWIIWALKTDPVMDPLRDDPRFADLLRRVGHAPNTPGNTEFGLVARLTTRSQQSR